VINDPKASRTELTNAAKALAQLDDTGPADVPTQLAGLDALTREERDRLLAQLLPAAVLTPNQ